MREVMSMFLAITLGVLGGNEVLADSAVWDVDDSANWSDNGNWNPTSGYPNGTSDDATLGSKITSTATITLTENIAFRNLTFNDDNQYTITGAYTLTPNGTTETIVHNSTGNAVIDSNLAFGSANRILTGSSVATQTWNGVLSGSAIISKNSSDTLILGGSNANTHTGRFYLNEGTVIMSKPAGTVAFESSGNSVYVGSGTTTDELRWMADNQVGDTRTLEIRPQGLVNLNGFSDVIGTLAMNGGTVETDGGILSHSGFPSGNGGTVNGKLHLRTDLGAGTLNVNNGYTLTINADISGLKARMQASGTVILNGNNTHNGIDHRQGSLALGNDHAIGVGELYFSGGSDGIMQEVIAVGGARVCTNSVRMSSNGYPLFGGTNDLAFTGSLSVDTDMTVTVSNTAPVTFSGNVVSASHPRALSKAGPGTLVLSGALIDYRGGTTIMDGTLQLDGAMTAQSSTVIVTNTGVLSGTGMIERAVSVIEGGTLAPGSTVGVLTITNNNLILDSTSLLKFDLGATSDRVDVDGDLTLDGTINIGDSIPVMPGTYRIFNYTGTLTDGGLTMGTFPAGYDGWSATVNTDTAKQVNIVVKGIPQGSVVVIR